MTSKRLKTWIRRLLAVAFTVTSLATPSIAQIVDIVPALDSLRIVNWGDIPAGVKYSLDTTVAGIDSLNVFSVAGMYASSSGISRMIPYCTFVVRDSLRTNQYDLTFVLEWFGIPYVTPILLNTYSPVPGGKGWLSLVVSNAGKPIDSMTVHCTVDFPASAQPVEQLPSAGDLLLLMRNYPNPFNGQTVITYTLARIQTVELQVFNLRGQLVREILKAPQNAGTHTVFFDARDLPSGTYFLRLSNPTQSRVMTMTLLR
jgi:hypothetical protein